MTSRDSILKAVREPRVPVTELPTLAHGWTRYADPITQFATTLEDVGGRYVPVGSTDELASTLAEIPEFKTASRVVSRVSGVVSTVPFDTLDDPHELENVDWAILPGELGVAENGAVWVTDEQVKHRAIYFIVQHLALVLPVDRIVHHLHEAYQHVAIGRSSLGLFISGPSKTADIEQSLVIGAHGPRSLTVFGLGRQQPCRPV